MCQIFIIFLFLIFLYTSFPLFSSFPLFLVFLFPSPPPSSSYLKTLMPLFSRHQGFLSLILKVYLSPTSISPSSSSLFSSFPLSPWFLGVPKKPWFPESLFFGFNFFFLVRYLKVSRFPGILPPRSLIFCFPRYLVI